MWMFIVSMGFWLYFFFFFLFCRCMLCCVQAGVLTERDYPLWVDVRCCVAIYLEIKKNPCTVKIERDQIERSIQKERIIIHRPIDKFLFCTLLFLFIFLPAFGRMSPVFLLHWLHSFSFLSLFAFSLSLSISRSPAIAVFLCSHSTFWTFIYTMLRFET